MGWTLTHIEQNNIGMLSHACCPPWFHPKMIFRHFSSNQQLNGYLGNSVSLWKPNSKSQPTNNNSLHSQLESLHLPPSILLTCREKHFRACDGRSAKVPACDRCWVRRREVEQSCRDTMDSDPIRDKSTRGDRFTLRHKHSVGTDLEAPVVWLLLRGRQKNKETRGGGREEHGVRRFLPKLSCLKHKTLQNNNRAEVPQRGLTAVWLRHFHSNVS